MARPRMPTALLELRGGFKNRPSRLRARQYEPIITTPLPEPPHYLPKAAREAWHEMTLWGFWLTSADRFLVEIAATLMAAYRCDQQKSYTPLLIGLLGTLGFSPRARGSMNLPTDNT
jgi:phage terminase small subunit